MRKKLGLLAAFSVLNLAIAAPAVYAGWDDDQCVEPDGSVKACCPSCKFWCSCSIVIKPVT
jgi:hypothetical protein